MFSCKECKCVIEEYEEVDEVAICPNCGEELMYTDVDSLYDCKGE